MVSCLRCKKQMHIEVLTGRAGADHSAINRITGFSCRCGTWIDLYVPLPMFDAETVAFAEVVEVAEPVVIELEPEPNVAVTFFDNIASMLRHKTSWQTIARLVQHACGAPVDADMLQQGYEEEKERRLYMRRQNREKGKAVAA